MRRAVAIGVILVIVAAAAAFFLPIFPSTLNSGQTITCSTPFPCQWNRFNRVPSQGRVTYHIYSSLTSYSWALSWGLQCSPDIGGCWFGNPNT